MFFQVLGWIGVIVAFGVIGVLFFAILFLCEF
jgi:hypothetical protein